MQKVFTKLNLNSDSSALSCDRESAAAFNSDLKYQGIIYGPYHPYMVLNREIQLQMDNT